MEIHSDKAQMDQQYSFNIHCYDFFKFLVFVLKKCETNSIFSLCHCLDVTQKSPIDPQLFGSFVLSQMT